MARAQWLLLGLALSLGWVPPLDAKTWVVSVGIETYDDADVSPVKYATRDATAIAELFGGDAQVALLTTAATDPGLRPTRGNLLASLEQVRRQAGRGDRFVLFFAGHGVETDGRQYLLPCDTRRRLLADTALPLPLLHAMLDGLQAGEVLFLLDACRNSPEAGRGESDAALSDGLSRGLRPALADQPTRRQASLLACSLGQRAWADAGTEHGVFTGALISAATRLRANGPVTLEAWHAAVVQDVRAWCERNQRQQEPQILTSGATNWVVLPASARPTPPAPAARTQFGDVGELRQPGALAGFVNDQRYATLVLSGALADWSAEHLRLLRAWVESGRRLVVGGELAQAFGFTVTAFGDETQYVQAIRPGTHRLLTGVERVTVDCEHWTPTTVTTGHASGQALLIDQSSCQYAWLAAAPYGQGEVIFRGSGALKDEHDRLVFERNWSDYLRRFPGAAAQPEPLPRQRNLAGVVRQPSAIAAYIADDQYVSLEVRCGLLAFTDEQASALQTWIKAGHRAAFTTDAAQLVGFTVEATGDVEQCAVAVRPNGHPLVKGLRALKTQCDHWTPFWFCTGHRTGVGLLLDQAGSKHAYLAVAPYGDGEVVFRSNAPLAASPDQVSLDLNWDEYLRTPVKPWQAP